MIKYILTILLTGLCTAQLFAQESDRVETLVPMRLRSGLVENTTKARATIYREAITVDDASAIRLVFGRTTLGQSPNGGAPTVLRITSYTDGAVQHLTSETLKQWQYTSAWFNGSMVLVEIIADPSTKSHLELKHVLVESRSTDRSICGATDNRILSDDPRVGRVHPNGCTAWIFDDTNHCFLTAGHCVESSFDVIEFNVPLSNNTGEYQHPGPEDQYIIDPESLQYAYESIGDDWGYFGCFPNTETLLTPSQAQGGWIETNRTPPEVYGQTIRITGFGSTSSPVDPTWNGAQKTHTGPYNFRNGSILGYAVDTTGGNSGSPVLNEETNKAIGIHTNGGCNTTGSNFGCGLNNEGLLSAIANPKGVCIPTDFLNFGFPNGLLYEVIPNELTPLVFTLTPGTENPVPDSVTVRTVSNGEPETIPVSYLGDDTYQATLPAQECDTEFGFYIEAQGDEGTFVTFPENAPIEIHEVSIGIVEEIVLIDQSFNLGLPTNWEATGLWHSTENCEPSGTCDGGYFMYYGQQDDCTYDSGDSEYGVLSTPAINITDITDTITLSFCYALETEDYAGYDTAKVYANGSLIKTLGESDEWSEVTIELAELTSHYLVISWEFDTIDGEWNHFRGFHIDGVTIESTSLTCEDPSCIGDMNADDTIDISDLLLLIDAWGSTNSQGDFDNNGIVDITDMLMLISAWGDCP
ncbi:MAG: hypothetical protein QGI78_04860 [Phycisphaerales bacterium]|jgi:V8-like Glu-specific endopeptidase|nr:hypothetical protein [Phycisphaerales bacterium]